MKEETPKCPPKDRFNFASEECGAKIIKTNGDAKVTLFLDQNGLIYNVVDRRKYQIITADY